MATTFTDEQAYDVCGVPFVERSHLRKWAGIDPNALTTRPDLLEQCLYWQDRRERYIKSPQVQNSYVEVHKAGLNVPSPRGVSIHDATRRGLYAQQPAQPAPQVRRGPQYRAQQTPDPELKRTLNKIQRELEDFPANFAAAVKRSEVKTRQIVNQPQKSMVTRGEVQPAQPAQPDFASMPPLPISQGTGKPSLLSAQIQAGMGMPKHPILNYPQFYQDQFLNYQLGNR